MLHAEYTAISSKNGFCTATGVKTKMAAAIARATACTFAVIAARVVDQFTEGITYACADSISISGLDAVSALCRSQASCCTRCCSRQLPLQQMTVNAAEVHTHQ